MKPVRTTRTVYHIDDQGIQKREDVIATEYALTIKVNGEEFATVVCTPEYMEDMVLGFLASEGVVKSITDVHDLYIQERLGVAQVTVQNVNQLYQAFRSKRYVTSCCGMTRQGFYFVNDAMTAKTMDEVTVCVPIETCFRLMAEMQDEAHLFQITGGVHSAALCTEDGILLMRTDIGRHNALDKIYGHCLRNNISLKGKLIVFSGRLSSEILLKVSKIGCEMVLSKSAPTELALEMADQMKITTVGFIRNESFNVYTHPERIAEFHKTKTS